LRGLLPLVHAGRAIHGPCRLIFCAASCRVPAVTTGAIPKEPAATLTVAAGSVFSCGSVRTSRRSATTDRRLCPCPRPGYDISAGAGRTIGPGRKPRSAGRHPIAAAGGTTLVVFESLHRLFRQVSRGRHRGAAGGDDERVAELR